MSIEIPSRSVRSTKKSPTIIEQEVFVAVNRPPEPSRVFPMNRMEKRGSPIPPSSQEDAERTVLDRNSGKKRSR